MNALNTFVDYLRFKEANISDFQYEKAKETLLDYLGVAYAGSKENNASFESFVSGFANDGQKIIGSKKTFNCYDACFINAFNAHSLELDDGSRFGMIHLGASIISSLISLNFIHRLDNSSLLNGIVLGYEAACRVACSIQPFHKRMGFHTSGTCGTIGASIACAVALKMNDDQIKRVLSCSCSSASGLLEIQEQSSMLKPFNLAQAAVNGLRCALFGLSKFEYPDDMLCGERGFLRVFSNDNVDFKKLINRTSSFEIERIYVKPYAACRHCHSPIEAALRLSNMVKVEDVKQINVFVYKDAIKGHDHIDISSISSAKLSIPYCVSIALLYKDVGLPMFRGSVFKSAIVNELIKKIKIIEDPLLSENAKVKRASRVEVVTINGDVFKETIEYAKGDFENPLTRDELFNKFCGLVDDEQIIEIGKNILYKTNGIDLMKEVMKL